MRFPGRSAVASYSGDSQGSPHVKQSLAFNGVVFNVVTHKNQPCLTLAEIAESLYGKGGDQTDAPLENLVRQLQKLYQRHADE